MTTQPHADGAGRRKAKASSDRTLLTRSTGTDVKARTPAAQLSSCVLFVRDLERSIEFYACVLELAVNVRTNSAALLVSAGGDQVVLREMGGETEHALGSIGFQYVIWTASSPAELERLQTRLKSVNSAVSRQVVDGITIVEGRDPNGLPIIVTHPGPDCSPRTHIFDRIYGW
jgi:catechol 2,3-dioxygenase-like lactoylglutathione lyase family enzyme